MREIEQIENESKPYTTIAESDKLMFKLITRADETKCVRERMGIELGHVTQRTKRIEANNCDRPRLLFRNKRSRGQLRSEQL